MESTLILDLSIFCLICFYRVTSDRVSWEMHEFKSEMQVVDLFYNSGSDLFQAKRNQFNNFFQAVKKFTNKQYVRDSSNEIYKNIVFFYYESFFLRKFLI